MKERDYEGMSKEDYDKLCAYCNENGYEEDHDDFSKLVDDVDCGSVLISIIAFKNHDGNPKRYCVGVAIAVGDIGGFFYDEIQVQKYVSSFDEFIDFISDVDKLKRMYKEFYGD